MAVLQAEREGLTNFSLLVSHVLVPPAIEALLSDPSNSVQGFLAAGHVCTIMGYWEYEPIAQHYRIPIVVTGFEPLDLLQGLYLCIRQLEEGRAEVENQYSRSVRRAGNRTAQDALARVFAVQPQRWRGIGEIPASGLGLKSDYASYDALLRFADIGVAPEHPGECISGEILRGLKKPGECLGLRHALHAGAPVGRDHGVLRRRLRRLLSLSPSASRRCERHPCGGREITMNETLSFALSCPILETPGDTIELAHGGGGLMIYRSHRRPLPPGVCRLAGRPHARRRRVRHCGCAAGIHH